MSLAVTPVSQQEIKESVDAAFHWFAEIVWQKYSEEKRIFAWPYYEKDEPTAHSVSQVAMALRAWGEEKESSIIKGMNQFIHNKVEEDKEGLFWRHPGRLLAPCPYTTALCIQCLYTLEGESEIVRKGFKWLQKTQLQHEAHRGGWPFTKGETRASVEATSIVLWCLSDLSPLYSKSSYVNEGLNFLQSEKVRSIGGVWGNYPWPEGEEDITATTFAVYALLKNFTDKNSEPITSGINFIKEHRDGFSSLKEPSLRYWKSREETFDTEVTIYAIRSLFLAGEDPRSEYIQEGIRWLIETHKARKRGWGNTEQDTLEGICAVHQSVDVLHLMREYLERRNWPPYNYSFERDFLRIVKGILKCSCGHELEFIREERITCPQCYTELIFEHKLKEGKDGSLA